MVTRDICKECNKYLSLVSIRIKNAVSCLAVNDLEGAHNWVDAASVSLRDLSDYLLGLMQEGDK